MELKERRGGVIHCIHKDGVSKAEKTSNQLFTLVVLSGDLFYDPLQGGGLGEYKLGYETYRSRPLNGVPGLQQMIFSAPYVPLPSTARRLQ